jgi:hypothetical protein
MTVTVAAWWIPLILHIVSWFCLWAWCALEQSQGGYVPYVRPIAALPLIVILPLVFWLIYFMVY